MEPSKNICLHAPRVERISLRRGRIEPVLLDGFPNIMTGDARLRAERRLDLALALRAEGDLPAALELFTAAIEEDPTWPEAHFVLAEALAKAGRAEDAAASYRAYLALDPEDRMGATAELAHLGAIPVPDRLPPAYVAGLFDQEARRYDADMLGALGYRGPDVVLNALTAILDRVPADGLILDAGCGTGLIGRSVRVLGRAMDGIDISEAMLIEAARTGLYRSLRRVDLGAEEWAVPGTLYDVIVAGDVFNYLGDLAPILGRAARALKPGGLLVFTVEANTGQGFTMGPARRFLHDAVQLRAWAQGSLFQTLALERTVLRQEARQPVESWVMTLALDGSIAEMPVPSAGRRTVPRDGQGSA